MARRYQVDFLVIGSGVAGLWYALQVAAHGTVAIVTKKEQAESNTNYAQGGIASVWSNADSFRSHMNDTIAAGAGLCDPSVVEVVVREGAAPRSGPDGARSLLHRAGRYAGPWMRGGALRAADHSCPRCHRTGSGARATGSHCRTPQHHGFRVPLTPSI